MNPAARPPASSWPSYCHEIGSYAQKRELMLYDAPATAEYGSSLSVLDVECRSHELLVQSFHLFDENCVVIKTQGIFEVVKDAK